MKKPHFYKEDSDAITQLEQLKEFNKTAPPNVKRWVEQEIKMLSYGIAGEEQVAFALVVECKNLIGHIEVNNRGEFI